MTVREAGSAVSPGARWQPTYDALTLSPVSKTELMCSRVAVGSSMHELHQELRTLMSLLATTFLPLSGSAAILAASEKAGQRGFLSGNVSCSYICCVC